MLVTREKCASRSFDEALGIARMLSFRQADRVHQKGADDRRVEALVVQHHDRVVETGLGVHHIAARRRLALHIANVGRDIALAVHARQIVVAERGDGATEVVDLQPRGVRALHRKLQQLGFFKDAQHQLAVANVVEGEGGLVMLKPPLDFCHLVVFVADVLAFAKQLLRNVLQTERRKAPDRCAQRFDAVDDCTPRHGRKQIVLLARMGAPCDGFALSPQKQWRRAVVRRFLQHAQVELNDVPANDDVRVIACEPFVEVVDHLLACRAIDQSESLRGDRFDRRLAQHEHHALGHAIQCNRIEILMLAGLDVQRHHLQHGPVAGRGHYPAVHQCRWVAVPTFQHDACGDEALHQEPFVRANIRLKQGHPLLPQRASQSSQLTKMLGVDAPYRRLPKALEFEFAQLHIGHETQQRFDLAFVLLLHKGHRRLGCQQHLEWACVRCQPILYLGARRRISPIAGQDEALAFRGGHVIRRKVNIEWSSAAVSNGGSA